jgi:hypothetical protein
VETSPGKLQGEGAAAAQLLRRFPLGLFRWRHKGYGHRCATGGLPMTIAELFAGRQPELPWRDCLRPGAEQWALIFGALYLTQCFNEYESERVRYAI